MKIWDMGRDFFRVSHPRRDGEEQLSMLCKKVLPSPALRDIVYSMWVQERDSLESVPHPVARRTDGHGRDHLPLR